MGDIDIPVFIPQLWENKNKYTVRVKENVKIITSNLIKYFILHSIPKETNVFVLSCRLKHKNGVWVDINSPFVTNKGGLVTVDYYPDYRQQTLSETVVVAEKYRLDDEDKVYQNKGDIVLYIEKGSSELQDFHEYINRSYWIKVKVVYLCW